MSSHLDLQNLKVFKLPGRTFATYLFVLPDGRAWMIAGPKPRCVVWQGHLSPEQVHRIEQNAVLLPKLPPDLQRWSHPPKRAA